MKVRLGEKERAKERAKELAFKYDDIRDITRQLEEENLGGLLDQNELDSVVIEAKAAKLLIAKARSKSPFRFLGVLAIVMGCVGIWIGAQFYGLAAVVIGIVLVITPSQANRKI